jgi:hypothetical protein
MSDVTIIVTATATATTAADFTHTVSNADSHQHHWLFD